MHPTHSSQEPEKPLVVVRRRRRKSALNTEPAVEERGRDELVREEVERKEQQRLLNRHFSDTNSAAFRHLDRQARWEYVQDLLRKTHVA